MQFLVVAFERFRSQKPYRFCDRCGFKTSNGYKAFIYHQFTMHQIPYKVRAVQHMDLNISCRNVEKDPSDEFRQSEQNENNLKAMNLET